MREKESESVCVYPFQMVHLGFLIFYRVTVRRVFYSLGLSSGCEVKAGIEVYEEPAVRSHLHLRGSRVPRCSAQRLWEGFGAAPLIGRAADVLSI